MFDIVTKEWSLVVNGGAVRGKGGRGDGLNESRWFESVLIAFVLVGVILFSSS